MTWVAVAVAGAGLVGGIVQSGAASRAAQTQADATARAQEQLRAAGQEAKVGYQPYTEAGTTALSDIAKNRAYFQNQFSNQDLNANLAPGYDFRLQQGQRANLQAANAAGGAISGNALRGMQDYAQNFASGEYANAFNQYQAQRTNIYNQLSDIAKIGLTGQQGSANAILGTGTNIASLTSGLGNAQAASQIAQGNAWSNVAQSLGNAGSYYAMNGMNQPINSSSAWGGTAGGGNFSPTAGNSFSISPA
jgi:hypothetical protein